MIDPFAFCIFLTLIIGVGFYRSRKIHSESAYLFADRKIGWAALTATLVMTEFNSATLISFSSLGYAAGFWALTLPFIFLFGLIFYALTVSKKWKEFDGTSVAGFFTKRYGQAIGKQTSILLLIAMLGFSAAYIKSLTLLFQPLLPSINGWLISGFFIAIIFLMCLRGGLIAIIRTDTVSCLLMLLFFPFLALFAANLPAVEPVAVVSSHEILPLRFLFSLIILTMFTYILAPWYGQKIFAAKSGKTAFWAVFSAAILVSLLYGSAIVATAFFRMRGFSCPSSQEALPHLIHRCLPRGVKGLAYALLFTTSATTLSGVWSAMSAMWVGDFLKTTTSKTWRRSMLATLSFAAISYLLANTLVDQVFDKLILANIPVAALSFGLLAGFYWKRASAGGVYLSILSGCICGVGAYWIFGEGGCYTWYWTVYGIPIIFLAGIVGSLLFKEKSFHSSLCTGQKMIS